MRSLLVLAPGALTLLATASTAQTLYVYDGTAAFVREVSGPPAGPCLYPDGPLFSEFAITGGLPCAVPGILPAPPDLRGDVAVNRPGDTIWVTDGERIAEFQPDGTAIHSFNLPVALLAGPILGLGFDGQTGSLWATDGVSAVEVLPPAVPCTAPAVLTGPFVLPSIGGPNNTITDIDWDPAQGSLWVCNESGAVGNVTTAGAIGPLGTYLAAPGACGLQLPLTGVTVDASAPTAGTVFVTDGFQIAHLEPPGTPAGPTFAVPTPCYPVPGGPTHGIGYSARPVTYGMGGPALGPTIGSIGQAVVPSTTLAITVSGAVPGTLGFLPVSLNPLCPALIALGMPVLIQPPAVVTLSASIGGGGDAVIPIAMPPGTSIGLEVFYQWFLLPSAGPSPPPADGPPILSTNAGSWRNGFQ